MADKFAETALVGDLYVSLGRVVRKNGTDVTIAVGEGSTKGGCHPMTIREDDTLNIDTLVTKVNSNTSISAANSVALDNTLLQSGLNNLEGHQVVEDNIEIRLGTGGDSRLSYDGTNTIWNLRGVGAGDLHISSGRVGIGGLPGQALDVIESTTGALSIRIDNLGANAASDARLVLRVSGSSGGDPHVKHMLNGGGTTWCTGLANGASDQYRICNQGNLDGAVGLAIATDESVRIPQALVVGANAAPSASAAAIEIAGTAKVLMLNTLTDTQEGLLAGLADGMIYYNSTTGKFKGRAVGSWVALH